MEASSKGQPTSDAHIIVRDLTMAYGSFVLMRDLELRRPSRGHLRYHGWQRLREEHFT